jgi:hypothetical protein
VIMDALKQVEAEIKISDLSRPCGVHSALLYRWRTKYG